jgi:hypothetical protein
MPQITKIIARERKVKPDIAKYLFGATTASNAWAQMTQGVSLLAIYDKCSCPFIILLVDAINQK